jgi:Cdc6-like AAA superfamily ATPase
MAKKMSRVDREDLEVKLRTVFKPTTPINSYELFSGRQTQSRQLVAAINQNGQHAILYGERGVGKTSLANILFFLLKKPGWPQITPHISCVRGDSYQTIWGRVFSKILDKAASENLKIPRSLTKFLKPIRDLYVDFITIDVVVKILSELGAISLLVAIIDEFDTVADDTVRAAIADTIKYLSDRNAPCTVVVVGVADDVEGLISDHRSVERCLAQVRMPRMSRDELEDIMRKCLTVADMTITAPALQEMSRISIGLPHYAHLLGLYSALQAIDNESLEVAEDDVKAALATALANADHTIQKLYLRATGSSQSTAKYQQVLLACAMAETNDLGFFAPADVRTPLSRILKKPARIEHFARHLHTFCEAESGPVLTNITIKKHPQFRFENALVQPFALIKGLAEGMITEEDLKATRDPNDTQQRLF